MDVDMEHNNVTLRATKFDHPKMFAIFSMVRIAVKKYDNVKWLITKIYVCQSKSMHLTHLNVLAVFCSQTYMYMYI